MTGEPSYRVGRPIPGHGLLNEGAAFKWRGGMCSRVCMGVSGTGVGRCSCGAVSPILRSGAARKAWHRRHKVTVHRMYCVPGGQPCCSSPIQVCNESMTPRDRLDGTPIEEWLVPDVPHQPAQLLHTIAVTYDEDGSPLLDGQPLHEWTP